MDPFQVDIDPPVQVNIDAHFEDEIDPAFHVDAFQVDMPDMDPFEIGMDHFQVDSDPPLSPMEEDQNSLQLPLELYQYLAKSGPHSKIKLHYRFNFKRYCSTQKL